MYKNRFLRRGLRSFLLSIGLVFYAASSIAYPQVDIDGNGITNAQTDGMLVIRHLFGFTGEELVRGIDISGGTRNTVELITAYLAEEPLRFDVDGDGRVDALTDGVLIARYLAGDRGAALINQAVSVTATRGTEALEAYLAGLNFDAGSTLPPDPKNVAPALPSGVFTAFLNRYDFMFDDTNPIQFDDTPNAVEPYRAAMVRGRVLDTQGNPLNNVRVSAHFQSAVGWTLTRNDGRYDLLVNGGGTVVVRYERSTHLVADRNLKLGWNEVKEMADVRLVEPDSVTTQVALGGAAPAALHSAGTVTDHNGSRTARLYVPAGTAAELVMPDGSTQPLSSMTLRATEFTIGTNGPEAMPAPLPPTSAYTYALEYSADEVTTAGAVSIQFDQPLYHYNENFRGFPVGTQVPTGYYDRINAVWVASDNGVIVEVLGESGGLAQLDLTGDGVAADAAALAAAGFSDDELQRLATLFAPGDTLWRAPILHFTPWDTNWGWGPPTDAVVPTQRVRDPSRRHKTPDCDKKGSIIDVVNQTVIDSVPLAGSALSLNYSSERVPGRRTTIELPYLDVGGASSSITNINILVNIAGQNHRFSATPPTSEVLQYQWDGLDGLGREVPFSELAYLEIQYEYDANYTNPLPQDALFATFSDPNSDILGSGAEQSIAFTNRQELLIANIDARRWGLGGWTLSTHHHYDPVAKWLLQGDGRIREIDYIDGQAVHSMNSPAGTPLGYGSFQNFVAAPDGSLYFEVNFYSGSTYKYIARLTPDETFEAITKPDSLSGATLANGVSASDIVVDPKKLLMDRDGSLIVVTPYQTFRIDAGGIVRDLTDHVLHETATDMSEGTQYAYGANDFYRAPPNGPWQSIDLPYEAYVDDFLDGAVYQSMAFDETGELFVSNGMRIKRVTLDGKFKPVAGSSYVGYAGDGRDATSSLVKIWAVDMAFGPDGDLYILNRAAPPNPMGLRRIGKDGVIETVLSIPSESTLMPTSFAFMPDGSVMIGERNNDTGLTRIRRYVLNGSDVSDRDPTIIFLSEDGSEAYEFDGQYRHLATRDTFTGATLHSFAYDAQDRLTRVTDTYGQVTQIRYDGSGTPSAIVSPDGQQTLLTTDANGYVNRIEDELGQGYSMEYDAQGLLVRSVDPNAKEHLFAYDDKGFLTRDIGPEGEVTTITATGDASAETVTITDPLGLVTRYAFDYTVAGGIRRTRTIPDGSTSVWELNADGSTGVTYPDGTTVTAWYEPDDRWGSALAVMNPAVVTTPGGLEMTLRENRSYTGLIASDPLSFSTLTETIEINGATYTLAFDRTTKTWSFTTAEGETRGAVYGDHGELQQVSLGSGLDPLTVVHNAKGEFTGLQWGLRNWSLDYDAGLVASLTDPLGGITSVTYDGHGHPLTRVQPSGRSVDYINDAKGRPLQYRLADGAVHRQTFSGNGKLTSYTPPGSATSIVRTYDKDRRLLNVDMPGGRQIVFDHDGLGQITGIRAPETQVTLGYSPATGFDSATSVWTNLASSASQSTAYSYDGFLDTEQQHSGSAGGTVSYSYDPSFRPVNIQVDAAGSTANLPITYDLDSQPSSIGGFAVLRSGPARQASSYADGVATVSLDYDSYGQLTRKTHAIGGSVFYQIDLVYNDLGLVTHKTETTAAGQHSYAYSYNADGSLLTVLRDGTEIEAYGYDDRDNRVSASYDQGAAQTAVYDLQDRLITRNGIAYQSDDDGYLVGRGTDSFTYAARGELIAANVGGTTLEYVYDAFGRQVARIHGSAERGYLYGLPGQPYKPLAAVDATDKLLLYVYDDEGRLLAIDRAGSRYYVGSDHLGSPRVLVDDLGQVVKRLDYDAYGRLLEDTAPAFDITLGFAGGIADEITGLVRFGMRDYEPASGRWTARDPILFQSRQTNLYGYVSNSPMSYTDPSGLICAGASSYKGFGGGGEACATSEGISACFEIGLGWGSGFGIKPNGGLHQWGNKVKAELAADLVLLGVNLKGELSDCGQLTAGWETEFLGQTHGHQWTKTGGSDWAYDLDNLKQNWQTSGKIDTKGVKEFVKSKIGSAKKEMQGKVAAEFCGSLTW